MLNEHCKILVAAVALTLLAGCAGNTNRFGIPEPSRALKSKLDSGAMIRIADRVREGGDYNTALRMYRDALERNPDNYQALLGLGATQSALRQHDDAHRTFSQALAINPGSAGARHGIANSLIARGRPRAALSELEELAVLDPRNSSVYNAMGVALDLLGQNRAAQVRYGIGLDLAPEKKSIRNNLALSFVMGGDYDTGIALLRDLAREPGNNLRTRQNLALAYGLSGDFESAEAVAGMDLTEDAVQSNLTFYAEIRGLQPRGRAIAVILGSEYLKLMEPLAANDSLPPMFIEPSAIAPGGAPMTTVAAGKRPFRLHFATYASRAQALVAWEMQLRRYQDLLDGLKPDVRELASIDGEASKYRLESVYRGLEPDAEALCNSASERGMTCSLTRD